MTTPVVTDPGQPSPDRAALEKLPKTKLIALILQQREDARIGLEEKDRRIAELSEQLAQLRGEIDQQSVGQKLKDINKHVNQPSSKRPEWDKDGNPKPAIAVLLAASALVCLIFLVAAAVRRARAVLESTRGIGRGLVHP